MEQNVQKTGRRLWLDAARVFAIISISSNHAINRSFVGFENYAAAFAAYPPYVAVLRAVIFIFSRLGVPIFLMISGALLLGKRMETKQDIARFYKHNLLRLFITSMIWYFIYYWFLALLSPEFADLRACGFLSMAYNCVRTLLFMDQFTLGNMWYIPMILCLYMLVPAVNIIINKYGSKCFLIPAALIILAKCAFPSAEGVLALTGHPVSFGFEFSKSGHISTYAMYMVYLIAGYPIAKGALRKLPAALVTAGAAVLFLLMAVYQYYTYKLGGEGVGYPFLLVAPCAALIFELFARSREAGPKRAVTYLAKIAFGIFFVHMLIVTALYKAVIPVGIHPILKFFIFETVSVGGAVIIVSLLSKIKVFKEYLFMIKD